MANDDVRPADCYARARLIAAEVELIRLEMGRPADTRAPLVVRDAAPREAYFAAIALFHKADQLCFEQTGDDLDALPPAPLAPQIRPSHVLAVLDAALREIHQVTVRLGITGSVTPPPVEIARQPSDVFTAIVQVNRQLNLLLERPFTPADVNRQITLATRYADRLCARAGLTLPAPATFERKKRPADVYGVLVQSLERVRKIATKGGLTALTLAGAGDGGEIVPGDVYDLATLALAEVVFLHAQSPDAQAPQAFEVHAPHRRLPAHCYQAASTLDARLALLETARS